MNMVAVTYSKVAAIVVSLMVEAAVAQLVSTSGRLRGYQR